MIRRGPDTELTLPFDGGAVTLGTDGTVTAVTHPDGVRPLLLTDDQDAIEAGMHEPARRWGTGFVVLDPGPSGSREGFRWYRPDAVDVRPGGVDLGYRLGPLELAVTRRVGAEWTETYALTNVSDAELRVGSFAVSTPWRDVYGSSRDCLHRAVHAHLWPGGADGWVWSQPMDGSGPGLGLEVTEGEMWAYSVESRDVDTSSNVRGHLYLHSTDHARAPHAHGGQVPIRLGPGESHRLGWRLRWHADLAAFRRSRSPALEVEQVTVPTGRPFALRIAAGATVPVPPPADAVGPVTVDAERDGRRSRVSLLAHPPLRDLVQARVRFVLDHQRPVEEPGPRAAAFVPYDNDSGLRVRAGIWADWNDARERVGTALLLQQARRLGWTGRSSSDELDHALAGYRDFVLTFLLDEDGTVHDDSRHADLRDARVRLYNFPWFARFLLTADGPGDLDRTVAVLDRYYALGGEHFLAFDLGPLLRTAAARLDADGRAADAVRLRRHLARHAAAMLAHGDDLPAHEVNYEQSMVAPLVQLLLAAWREDPGSVPAPELERRLAWLTAFAADQPDARLRHVPIRHWDGYWFGLDRRWGDTFPHYWSALSAEVFLDWPDELGGTDRAAELRDRGIAILRANLASFDLAGRASCAFVYPSCVNGVAAHVADPLANDQDWALVYALRCAPDL